MNARLLLGTALGLSLLAMPAMAQDEGLWVVTSAADGGSGSLHEALGQASTATGPVQIVIAAPAPIVIASGLSYDGSAPLTLLGDGAVISTAANDTLLTVTSGDLAIVVYRQR